MVEYKNILSSRSLRDMAANADVAQRTEQSRSC